MLIPCPRNIDRHEIAACHVTCAGLQGERQQVKEGLYARRIRATQMESKY